MIINDSLEEILFFNGEFVPSVLSERGGKKEFGKVFQIIRLIFFESYLYFYVDSCVFNNCKIGIKIGGKDKTTAVPFSAADNHVRLTFIVPML